MGRPALGEARREEILAAFEACVVEKGLEGTTLANVAEAAGQPRSLVRYFIGNRADMVSALIDRVLARGEACLEEMADAGPSDPLERTLDLLWDRIFEDPITNAIMMELWHLALRDPMLQQRLAAVYGRMVLEVSALLGPETAGRKAASDVEERAFASVSMALGAAVLRRLGLTSDNPDRLRQLAGELPVP